MKIGGVMINIVYCSNEKYAKYLCVTLYSLIEHTNSENNYNITILETDISDELKKDILSLKNGKDYININFVNVKQMLDEKENDKLFCHLYFTKEMYLRIFIPNILKDCDKAIYIDIDTMIMDDIAKLYQIDLEDYYVAAAKDFNSIVNVKFFDSINKYFNECLKIKDMNNYFNSGVLLMNLQKLREINVVQKTYDILEKFKELLYPDQDVLNLICEDHVKIIDNNWNFVPLINVSLIQDETFQNLAAEWAIGLADRKLIHYISEEKPWDEPKRFYSAGWWKKAKETPVYQKLLSEYFQKHPEDLNP